MYLEYKHGKITSLLEKQGYSIEDLKKSSEEHTLHIILTQDQSIDDVVKDVARLLKETKGSNIKVEDVVLELDKGYLYTEEEIQHLRDLNGICEGGNLHLDIKTENHYENFDRFVISRKIVEDFAEKVDNLKINGQNLSPAEKFMCCYAFAANRRYNMGEKDMDDAKRNWIGVLSGDEVICTGFASTLKMLCDRVFSKEEVKCYRQGLTVDVKKTGGKEGHANNIVFINDSKYGIHGFFYCDACWDCLKENKTPNFAHCLLPLQQAKGIKWHGTEIGLIFEQDDFFYHPDEPYQRGRLYDREGLLTDLDKMFGKKSNKEISEEVEEQYKLERQKFHDENRDLSFSEWRKKSEEIFAKLEAEQDKDINDKIAQKHREILAEGGAILFAQQPPKELFENGLFAVAKCFDMSDEQARAFVQEKLENRQQTQKILFGGTVEAQQTVTKN